MSQITVFEILIDGKPTGTRYLSQGEADAYLDESTIPASHTSRPARVTVKPVLYTPVETEVESE